MTKTYASPNATVVEALRAVLDDLDADVAATRNVLAKLEGHASTDLGRLADALVALQQVRQVYADKVAAVLRQALAVAEDRVPWAADFEREERDGKNGKRRGARR